MTGYCVPGFNFSHLGDDRFADLHTFPASRVKFTTWWRVRGRRNAALKDDAICPGIRIRDRGCAQEGLGVRVQRILEYMILASVFNQVTQIHDTYIVRNVLHY
jgi:hypothetical protein